MLRTLLFDAATTATTAAAETTAGAESAIDQVKNYITSGKMIWTLVILAAAIAIWIIIRTIARKQMKKINNQKVERNGHIVLTAVKVVVMFLAIILILQVNGINITSLVAGLSLTTVVIGFALQSLLADWIMGATIMAERFFVIGDVVQIGDVAGRVTEITLKTTHVQSMITGDMVSISNRNVSIATVLSDWLEILVPFPYETKSGDMARMLEAMLNEMRKIDGIKGGEVKGLQSFDASQITQLIRLHVDDPYRKAQLKREAQGVVLTKFEEFGVSIPFNQLDVHIKDGEQRTE